VAEASVEIMRTFVYPRQRLAAHEDLARKIDELEPTQDSRFRIVFDARGG